VVQFTRALEILELLGDSSRWCVEIGASTGGSTSPTMPLVDAGYDALWIERDDDKFASLVHDYTDRKNVCLCHAAVTPENICTLLASAGAPQAPGMLSLDIDGVDYHVLNRILGGVPEKFGMLSIDTGGYDYYTLNSLLGGYRPLLIHAEVNEKIPPPVKFTIKNKPEYRWTFGHLYGMSIALLNDLAEKYDYGYEGMYDQDIVLIDKRRAPEEFKFVEYPGVYDIYRRSELARSSTSYNHNVEHWLDIDNTYELVDSINEFYADYRDDYNLWLGEGEPQCTK